MYSTGNNNPQSNPTFSSPTSAPTSEKRSKNFIEKLTKIQAVVRGHQTRKSIHLWKEQHKTAPISAKNNAATASSTIEKAELQYVTDYKFPNGAIYTGTIFFFGECVGREKKNKLQDFGKTGGCMGKGHKYGRMEQNMKDIGKMARLMAKESSGM